MGRLVKISGVGGTDASASADPLQTWQQLLRRSPEPAAAPTERNGSRAAAREGGDPAAETGRASTTPPAEPAPTPPVEELAARAIGKLVNLSAEEVLQRLRNGVRLDRLLAEHGVSTSDLATALDHFLAGHRRLDVRA